MDLTATICRPTEEDEDGDPGKSEEEGGGKEGDRQKRVQRSSTVTDFLRKHVFFTSSGKHDRSDHVQAKLVCRRRSEPRSYFRHQLSREHFPAQHSTTLTGTTLPRTRARTLP
ncbi:UNVERIFIED_CONTAM: hypothetical protein FKN15_047034 [Acipenser sinensis]